MRKFVPVLLATCVLLLFPLGLGAVSAGPNGYGRPPWQLYVLVAWLLVLVVMLLGATCLEIRRSVRRRAESHR
jgi:hypothetical protein